MTYTNGNDGASNQKNRREIWEAGTGVPRASCGLDGSGVVVL